ncbi:MAG: deoxyribodipyrimidine photo-lyase [Bacteroidetes bacterium]|nr:MAG: deoxyribodipyrimidine photo-lyase [Bacteroidota bacterium]
MKALFWHRRDLRSEDNAGLYKALKSGASVIPVFIFDSNILSELPENDKRVSFIYDAIKNLKSIYQQHGSDLIVRFGDPIDLIPKLAEDFNAKMVFTNRDYEPYALDRDRKIFDLLNDRNIQFTGTKDHVIFEKNEILKNDGKPYTVFTPYSKKWKEKLNDFYLSSYPTSPYFSKLEKCIPEPLLTLKEMGFLHESYAKDPNEPNVSIIDKYHLTRDLPAIHGTSRLSVHLRFGTISIRELCRIALKHNPTYLNELIWRDFYQMIIYHFPHSAINSFRKEYDSIRWEHNDTHFKAWCEGKTGYPLVDAGMRELNETGFMHNRVRMVTASFLTKHLLLDWRLGEAYFAMKLMDFDLASNVGGWQWAAGSGCDAAPYFRVFNPTSQQEKFDSKFEYIKKWVPEYGTSSYPEPIVEHKMARERAIERYRSTLKK